MAKYKNIIPALKPNSTMKQMGIQGNEHGEVDEAVDKAIWAGGKFLKWISSAFGGLLLKAIIIILIVSILTSLLAVFIKFLVEDISELFNPTVGQTGEYVRKVSEIESKSFSKAYNFTSENILSALVSEESPFATLFSGEDTIDKKKELLAEYIKNGYVSMRDYSEYNGYLLFDMCVDGDERVFAILEDETIGNKEDKKFSSDGNVKEWTNRLVIIDFGQKLKTDEAINILSFKTGINEDDINNFIGEDYFIGLDDSSASLYYLNVPASINVMYNNIGKYLGLLKDNDTETAEFEVDISDVISDIYSSSNSFKETDRMWLEIYARHYIIRHGFINEIEYIKNTEGSKTEYIIEYKNGTIMNQGISVAMLEAMYGYLYDYVNMEICGIAGVASPNVSDGVYLDKRYEAFVDFMSQEKVWKRLLEYNIEFDERETSDSYELKDGDRTVVISNIIREKTAVVNIDICNYETLISMFDITVNALDIMGMVGGTDVATGIIEKYGDGKCITVSLYDTIDGYNDKFINYMEGTSFSYRTYDDSRNYAEIKFIESNCYIKGEKMIELVNNGAWYEKKYGVYKDYRFRVYPGFGHTSYIIDSIKINKKILTEDEYEYDKNSGYYTITAAIINTKIGNDNDIDDFINEFLISIEAHGTGIDIDNVNFEGFRYFAARDYIESIIENGIRLYDVKCYIAEYNEYGNIQITDKLYTGKYDVIYKSEFKSYESGNKRGEYTLYVVSNSCYTSDFNSSNNFLYYTSDDDREMTLSYYFNSISKEGKLINHKLGSNNNAVIIDPAMAYMHFTEGCRISGDETANMLTEAGYIRSSVFWQYKTKMYSAMFIDPTAEPIYMPFFVDKNYILDIEEVKNATTAGKQTTTYIIYCEPGTIVYQPNTCYVDSIYGVSRNNRGSNYYFISQDGSEYNSDISDIVRFFATDREDYDPIKYKDENGNIIEVDFAHSDREIYNTYYLSDLNYRYKLANIQVKYIDINDNIQYILTDGYEYNHYNIYLKNPAYKNAPTIEEYFMDWAETDILRKSGFPDEQPTHYVEDLVNIYQPVILGCTIASNTIEKYGTEGVSAFTLEIYPRYSSSNRYKTVSREIDIFKLFDINPSKDIYFDEGSGFFWPAEGEVQYKNALIASNDFIIVDKDESIGKLYIADRKLANVYTLSDVDFELSASLGKIYKTGDLILKGDIVYFINNPNINKIETNINYSEENLFINDNITIINYDYITNSLAFVGSEWKNIYIVSGVDVADIIISQLKKDKIEYAIVIASMQSNGLKEIPKIEDWEFVKNNLIYLGEVYNKDYKNLTGITIKDSLCLPIIGDLSFRMSGTGLKYSEALNIEGKKLYRIAVDRRLIISLINKSDDSENPDIYASIKNEYNGKEFVIEDVISRETIGDKTFLYLSTDKFKISVGDTDKSDSSIELYIPVVDGYETFGNGLFKSGVAIPYPEGHYREDAIGIYTPVYVPVDAYVYDVICTDESKGIYNLILYNEEDEIYFEFVGIYSYYDTYGGRTDAFYPSKGERVIAGDYIGKHRRIDDSGGIENSEWYHSLVYLIYNDNMRSKSVRFDSANNVLVAESAFIYDVISVAGKSDLYDISLMSSKIASESSIYYTYHNVKIIDKSIVDAFLTIKEKEASEGNYDTVSQMLGSMFLSFNEVLAQKTDSSYMTIIYGSGDKVNSFVYYYNPMYFYTNTDVFNRHLIKAAFYNEFNQKISSLIIYDDDYSNMGTSADIKLGVSPEVLPDGYELIVVVEQGNHHGKANIEITRYAGEYLWHINLKSDNGYGTDYLVAYVSTSDNKMIELARCTITVPSYADYGKLYLSCEAEGDMISNSYYLEKSLRYDIIALYPDKIININDKSFLNALESLLNMSSSDLNSIASEFGYLDLFVPKTVNKPVKYDFDVIYNGSVSYAEVDWLLYKATYNNGEYGVSSVNNNQYININEYGILTLMKDENKMSAANTDKDFYIVCAKNKSSGALAYSVIRIVQPIESIEIAKCVYTFNASDKDISYEYNKIFKNLHMTPFGELTLNYSYSPVNATYKNVDITISDISVSEKNISDQFIISFAAGIIKIKFNPDYKNGVVYDYFSGKSDIDFINCKFEIGNKKSGIIKTGNFITSADIVYTQILPWDGDNNNISNNYDTINDTNPAIFPLYSEPTDYYPIARLEIYGYYCEPTSDGNFVLKEDIFSYTVAKSVCKTGILVQEISVSHFSKERLTLIEGNYTTSGNMILEVAPSSREEGLAELINIRIANETVNARLKWVDLEKIITYDVDGVEYSFYPYKLNGNYPEFPELDEELFIELYNDVVATPFGNSIYSLFKTCDILDELYQWKITAYAGDDSNGKFVGYIDLAKFLYLVRANTAAERICDAKGIPQYSEPLNMASVLGHTEGYTKYIFEKVAYNITNEEERCIIAEILTGKTMRPVFSLAAGEYEIYTHIEIMHPNRNAKIYYTLDGSIPTEKSSRYEGYIVLNDINTYTIRAVAIVDNYYYGSRIGEYKNEKYISEIETVIYKVMDNSISFSPTPGEYPLLPGRKFSIIITYGVSDAIIYYTINGSIPTISDNMYAGPIKLSEGSYRISARAYKNGIWSEVMYAYYIIGDVLAPKN